MGLTVRHNQTAAERRKDHFFMGAKVKHPLSVILTSHKAHNLVILA